MKIVYGYQADGRFLLAKAGNALSEDVSEIKRTLDAVQLEDESYVELSRAECQKVSKHMQFGKKGDIRVMDVK